MEWVILVIVLALIEYLVFSFRVGMARVKYNIAAPAVSGHPVFERFFRVQQNTLEQLVMFVPAMLAFSWAAESVGWQGYYMAASLGVVWLIGRLLYAVSYVSDPKSRGIGFVMTVGPSVIMMLGALVCIVISLL